MWLNIHQGSPTQLGVRANVFHMIWSRATLCSNSCWHCKRPSLS